MEWFQIHEGLNDTRSRLDSLFVVKLLITAIITAYIKMEGREDELRSVLLARGCCVRYRHLAAVRNSHQDL